jgi:hypothetical protein
MSNIYRTNDTLVLTQKEVSAIVGTTTPRRDRQINSIKVDSVYTGRLDVTGHSYLRGSIDTPLIIGHYITTLPGENLVLNPSGPSIDCSNKTLINVAGFSANANRYDVIAPTYVITTDAVTPTTLLTIPLTSGYTYNIRCDVALAHVTDGTSAGAVVITCTGKDLAGVASVLAPFNTINKAVDAPLAGVTVQFTVSGSNILVTATGIAATTVRWFAAAIVTRSQY